MNNGSSLSSEQLQAYIVKDDFGDTPPYSERTASTASNSSHFDLDQLSEIDQLKKSMKASSSKQSKTCCEALRERCCCISRESINDSSSHALLNENKYSKQDCCETLIPDNLIENIFESHESVTFREAWQAGCCCLTPDFRYGEIVRNCLCCSTWSTNGAAGAVGIAAIVNVAAMKTIFLPIFGCLAITNLCCYCRVIRPS